MAEPGEIIYKCDNDSKPIDLENCLIVSRTKKGEEPQQWIFENETCLAEFIQLEDNDTPSGILRQRIENLAALIKSAF